MESWRFVQDLSFASLLPYSSFSIFLLSLAVDTSLDPSSSEAPHARQIALEEGKNVPAQGASVLSIPLHGCTCSEH